MIIQIFAFAMCFFGLTIALMVQQLPEHQKIAFGMESAATAAPGVTQAGDSEPGAAPRTSRDRCAGFHGEDRWACQRAWAGADSDFDDDEPQEEPELD